MSDRPQDIDIEYALLCQELGEPEIANNLGGRWGRFIIYWPRQYGWAVTGIPLARTNLTFDQVLKLVKEHKR